MWPIQNNVDIIWPIFDPPPLLYFDPDPVGPAYLHRGRFHEEVEAGRDRLLQHRLADDARRSVVASWRTEVLLLQQKPTLQFTVVRQINASLKYDGSSSAT